MTNQELLKLLGKKIGGIATDISAIEARIATVEDKMISRLDWIETQNNLRKVEKRLTAVEGKLAKVVTKKELSLVEKRIIKKLNTVIDYFDKEVLETKDQVRKIEQRLGFVQI